MPLGERRTEEPRTGGKPPPSIVVRPRAASPPQALLALQRRYGNRVIARSVKRQLARDLLTADAPKAAAAAEHKPWAEQTTLANRRLSTEVDALERLDNAALQDLRDQLALKASKRADDKHAEHERALEAAEFLTARRGIAPLAYKDTLYYNDRNAARRRNVRAVIEQGIRETGSLEHSIEGMTVTRDVEDDVEFFKKEAEGFGQEFTRQARDIGQKMLVASGDQILDVIESYGLKRERAVTGRNDVLRGEKVDDVVDQIVRDNTVWTPDPASTKDADPTTWGNPRKRRVSLAKWVRKLKPLQEAVRAAQKARDEQIGHAPHQPYYIIDEKKYAAANEQIGIASKELEVWWGKAERAHPVLAAFRGGTADLSHVDLDALDDTQHGSQPQMAAMLSNLLEKLVDIRRVQGRMMYGGGLNPLSLPPVVAVTKAAMLVPEGSIRDGKVNDLVAAAQDKSIAQYIAEGLIALIVLATVLPSGGSSLGIAIGLTGAALSATSAIEDWETYQRQKMLVNTALGRAEALATEEPSLLPFAVDLVSLGFDGLPLVKAFGDAVELRNLVRAEASIQNTKRINKIVDELNDLGKAKGDAKLGAKARTAAEEDATKTTKTKPPDEPKPRDKVEVTEERVPVAEKKPPKAERKKGGKAKETDEPAEAGKGEKSNAKRPPPVKPTAPLQETRALNPDGTRRFYRTEQELRGGVHKAIEDAVSASKQFKDERLTVNFGKLHAGLKARDPVFAKRFLEYFSAIENEAFVEEKIVKLWKLSRDDQRVVADELEHLLGHSGSVNKLYTTGLEDDVAAAVFKAGLEDPRPMVDLNFASDFHGSHTHMFEEWLGDELWGAGEGAAFRRRLAQEPNYSDLWDVLFDAQRGDALHRPETLGRILQDHADFPRFPYP